MRKRTESGVALCQEAIGTVRASDVGERGCGVVVEGVVGHIVLRCKGGQEKGRDKSDSRRKQMLFEDWLVNDWPLEDDQVL